MAQRAGSALAALLAAAAMALPSAVLATQGTAAAASATGAAGGATAGTARPTTQIGSPDSTRPASKVQLTSADQSGSISVVITGLSPQWASSTSKITMTGVLRNTSHQAVSGLMVQLLGSTTAISSTADLQPSTAEAYGLANTDLPGATWHASAPLPAGASVRWSVSVRASAIGMTSFGVYPLAAQAENSLGTLTPVQSVTYLPYEPPKKGAYRDTRPTPVKTSWVWPLIDQPLLDQPWQNDCLGSQAQALAQSVGPGGRLSDLLSAGQSLARTDAITWEIDSALLANVRALAACRSSHPAWARAASDWLGTLSSATAGQPLFVTPYGDPNVTTLIMQGHADDVQRSFQLGRQVAGRVLDRNVNPPAAGGPATALGQANAIAWPSDGTAGYSTLENLAPKDGVRTLLLNDSALPAETATVMRTTDGAGSYVDVLLVNSSLTRLFGSATTAPGSAFSTAQRYLAETALLAQQGSGQALVLAPPDRWQPPAGLASALLADTASAPWLRPTGLTTLTAAKRLPHVELPNTVRGHPNFDRAQLAQLSGLDRQISQVQALREHQNGDLYLAVSAIESSAYQGRDSPTASAMLTAVSARLTAELRAIQIVAVKRITLGGLKGTVTVSIDNRLGTPVQVGIQLLYSHANGVKITQSARLVTIPARTDQPVKLHVQTSQIGSTIVTMQLVNRYGQALPAASQRLTVQATQVGVLGMIIFAAAMGIFLIAYAARAVRRGRPAAADGAGTAATPPADPETEGSGMVARPDTVMAEHIEQGRASTPGP